MTSRTATGHWPTLLACFLHFDVSFMIWVLLGALGIYITQTLTLSPSEQGLVVAIPILSGSLLRVPLGLLGDRFGGKRVGTAMLALLFVPLTWGWLAADSLPALAGIGLLLGVAGASFAVALPLASRWYPSRKQGLVMGIAAAGNSGTVIANLAAPRLADAIGWHNVFGAAMIPLALVLAGYAMMAKESADSSAALPLRRYLVALRTSDLWWLCSLYGITFGGYVGLSSILPIFAADQFGVSPVTAGAITAAAAFVGSGVRPLGGLLADRLGGANLLAALLVGIAAGYGLLSQLPGVNLTVLLLAATMMCLGLGNGAVFQLVAMRFRLELGLATGVIGAVGGLGGFLLPVLLGGIRQLTGSYGHAFLALAALAFGGFLLLRTLVAIRSGWRASWQLPHSARPAGD